MKANKTIKVLFKNRTVGMLAVAENNQIAFEYSESWLKNGFSISPFSLPLKKKVFVPSKFHFDGLFGVF